MIETSSKLHYTCLAQYGKVTGSTRVDLLENIYSVVRACDISEPSSFNINIILNAIMIS